MGEPKDNLSIYHFKKLSNLILSTGEMIYFFMLTTTRKSLLYKSGVEYADYCINHVEGCSHGCRFPCYAMMMKKRCGVIKDYNDWLKPKIVSNALELLDQEIPKLKHKIKVVHLCFTTDPFMYQQKEVEDLTLKIIEKLNRDGIRCTVLTKGIYPKALTNTKKYGENNEYAITLVSLDENFKKRYEPFSAPYEPRIKALKYLHDKGLKTWVSMEPYPTPNLVEQNLNKILERIKFVDKIIFGKLNYNVKTSEFEDNKNFYQECAELVIDFCEKNNIERHIKYGTQKKDNKKTERIFRGINMNDKVNLYGVAQARLKI
ncbi:MAG: Radical SAM domain protein [Candidatus Kuenenbacteria bacterium GW2011_GWA2_42_15]|uniref:Radical SAM domain protein n=3 Tax=Candidatus Kueneniibacteriota TaxID=1752740 RepID=A0A0G0YV98_9BACT|nr:MAG: Radical SAM domain protein [Candidatus Kuenenbacteria bacterium GW2011_GWA2_42_15]